MIFFLSTPRNRHPIDNYLASWGKDYRRLIQPIPYPALFQTRRLRPGIYFFADLELLTAWERERAGEVRRDLEERGDAFVAFNHPIRSLRRYELLATLHAKGINDFAVYRPGEDLSGDHSGHKGEMLAGPEELSAALASLPPAATREEWLITEFCDTSDDQGVFRKYSALLVGGRVIPRHVFFSHGWSQKRADLLRSDLLALEDEYVRTNPHEAEIREIFRLARLDYGRIDYGVRDERLQIWEINTNPMILSFDSAVPGLHTPIHRTTARALHDVWDQLRVTRAPASRSPAATMLPIAPAPMTHTRAGALSLNRASGDCIVADGVSVTEKSRPLPSQDRLCVATAGRAKPGRRAGAEATVSRP